MSVYHLYSDKHFEQLFSEKEVAGLFNYVVDGAMSDEGIEKICDILNDFKRTLTQLNMGEPHVFGTASLRNISNSEYTVSKIEEKTKIKVEIVSGEEEGNLGYFGIRNETNLNSGLMVDIGGGSAEFVKIHDNSIVESVSYPIGSLALFRRNVSKIFPKKKEIQKIEDEIENLFSNEELKDLTTDKICFIGGTGRAVLKIYNHLYRMPSTNRKIDTKNLKDTIKFLESKTNDCRNVILKECPDRLHTIIPGSILLYGIVKHTGATSVYVGKYGAREGYLCRQMKKLTL